MADQTITPIAVAYNTVSAKMTGADVTASNDGVFTFNKKDEEVLFMITVTADGSSSGVLSVKDGVDGSNNIGDLTIDVYDLFADGEVFFLRLETSRFKALSGTDKGKVRFDITTGDCQLKIAAITTP